MARLKRREECRMLLIGETRAKHQLKQVQRRELRKAKAVKEQSR